MENFSIGEVIEQAVQTEKLGYDFYTTMAKRFEKNEGVKKLFDTLAVKELRHEKTFLELKNLVSDADVEGWEEVSQYLRAIVESEFFLGKNKALPSLDHVKTAEEAVKFAIGFEKETLLYFQGIRDAVKEKRIVDEIIKEEKSHIIWLSEYLRNL